MKEDAAAADGGSEKSSPGSEKRDRKSGIKGYSPSFKSEGGNDAPKLLKRRESLAPVRIRTKTNASELDTEGGEQPFLT